MTEQERRSAIEALGALCYHKIKRRSWYAEPQNVQEDLMYATITALRALNDKGQLNALRMFVSGLLCHTMKKQRTSRG
jgi:hypothetical protein